MVISSSKRRTGTRCAVTRPASRPSAQRVRIVRSYQFGLPHFIAITQMRSCIDSYHFNVVYLTRKAEESDPQGSQQSVCGVFFLIFLISPIVHAVINSDESPS